MTGVEGVGNQFIAADDEEGVETTVITIVVKSTSDHEDVTGRWMTMVMAATAAIPHDGVAVEVVATARSAAEAGKQVLDNMAWVRGYSFGPQSEDSDAGV